MEAIYVKQNTTVTSRSVRRQIATPASTEVLVTGDERPFQENIKIFNCDHATHEKRQATSLRKRKI